MKIIRFVSVFILYSTLYLPMAFAFHLHGYVTQEINFKDLEIYPPKTNCHEPVVKGDPNANECMPKVSARLSYAFTRDQTFKATLLFYNIFDEIMGEAEIDEFLRCEEDHIDIVDYIYMYPEFDFNAIQKSHHIKWEIHGQHQKIGSTQKE